jgi:hypothetical protein
VRLVGNFLECCRSRALPAEDVELGNFVTTTAHLGNLALRTGRSIEFDAANAMILPRPVEAAQGLIAIRGPFTHERGLFVFMW